MKRIGKHCLAVLLFLALIPLCAQQDAATRMNRIIGLPLLSPGTQWTRQELEKALLGQRLMFQGDKSRRSTFLQGRKIFEVPATELLVVSDTEDMVTQVDVIYSNKGDSAKARNMKRDIRKSGRSLKAVLTRILGNPVRDEFGPEGLQKEVLAWKYGEIRFLLETSREEYTILHICYRKKADHKPKRKELRVHKEEYSANVRGTPGGDVYVDNIPMVNQGPKGYCVPATVERVLRYYGINQITMHQLAEAAGTGRGGGTSVEAMNHAIGKLRRNFGLDIHSCGEVKIETLKKYIDQGIPVMWAMYVNPAFVQLLQNSRAVRPNAKSPEDWLKSIRKYKLSRGGEGHVCLIVGYNARTEEIAISNSWGDQEKIPAWIPLKFAVRVSQKATFVLVPKK
ncbi:MAG: C39 family peptidase [Lentisphaeria bacterium]|nr:C39 family peptidase [Lentisphaeria bacterium]